MIQKLKTLDNRTIGIIALVTIPLWLPLSLCPVFASIGLAVRSFQWMIAPF